MNLARFFLPVVLSLAAAGSAHALEPDKVKHLEVSFVLGIAGEQLAARYAPEANSIAVGAAIALVPGLAKELWDARRKGYGHPEGFSGKDLAADAVGALAGAVVSNLVSSRLSLSLGRDAAGAKKVSATYTVAFD